MAVDGELDGSDEQRMAAWLAQALPGDGGLKVSRLEDAGHSNLTFTASRDAGHEWIVRRPPAGPLQESAHDVLREARFMRLLAEVSAVRVPHVAAVCDDTSVVGVPFYAMERLQGEVVRESIPDWLQTPERRRHFSHDVVRTLAEIHAAPPEPFVAARLGRADGYVARQISRWAHQWDQLRQGSPLHDARRGDADEAQVRKWLLDRSACWDETEPTVVHGDFKLDNLICNPSTGTVLGVLDWELATVGEPMADLGYLLSHWPDPGDRTVFAEFGANVVTAPGFLSRAELIASYEEASGRAVPDMKLFEVLAVWKLAVLLEASYSRFVAGAADDPFFAQLLRAVPALLARARSIACC